MSYKPTRMRHITYDFSFYHTVIPRYFQLPKTVVMTGIFGFSHQTFQNVIGLMNCIQIKMKFAMSEIFMYPDSLALLIQSVHQQQITIP